MAVHGRPLGAAWGPRCWPHAAAVVVVVAAAAAAAPSAAGLGGWPRRPPAGCARAPVGRICSAASRPESAACVSDASAPAPCYRSHPPLASGPRRPILMLHPRPGHEGVAWAAASALAIPRELTVAARCWGTGPGRLLLGEGPGNGWRRHCGGAGGGQATAVPAASGPPGAAGLCGCKEPASCTRYCQPGGGQGRGLVLQWWGCGGVLCVRAECVCAQGAHVHWSRHCLFAAPHPSSLLVPCP